MSSDGYSWVEKRKASYSEEMVTGPGCWRVAADTRDGGVCVDVEDCGCCGSTEVLHVESVEEFDKEWKRIGKMLRTHVRRATER